MNKLDRAVVRFVRDVEYMFSPAGQAESRRREVAASHARAQEEAEREVIAARLAADPTSGLSVEQINVLDATPRGRALLDRLRRDENAMPEILELFAERASYGL